MFAFLEFEGWVPKETEHLDEGGEGSDIEFLCIEIVQASEFGIILWKHCCLKLFEHFLEKLFEEFLYQNRVNFWCKKSIWLNACEKWKMVIAFDAIKIEKMLWFYDIQKLVILK